jgi:hypothetical protein
MAVHHCRDFLVDRRLCIGNEEHIALRPEDVRMAAFVILALNSLALEQRVPGKRPNPDRYSFLRRAIQASQAAAKKLFTRFTAPLAFSL